MKRKLNTLTYSDKLRAIEAVKSGSRRKDVAAQFGIHESTLSLIMKKEEELLKKQELGVGLQCKRRRIAEFPDLEQCLFTWFKQCRDKNISISGPILKEKAEEFAKSLNINQFKASNGWLENFKKRHELTFKKVCGESASVSGEVCREWKSKLECLVEGYSPNDIFNADELALFYKCLPDKTLTFKNEKCHGGKHSKERLTILLCVNSSGTEKLKPLMAWRNVTPSTVRNCFKSCGFPSSLEKTVENQDDDDNVIWNKYMTEFQPVESQISFDDYVTCDDEVATAGTLTEQEIIDAVLNKDEVEDDENGDLNDLTPDPPISISGARKAVNDLRAFIERCEDINDEIFSSLHNIERIIDVENQKCMKQKKITDFFLKN